MNAQREYQILISGVGGQGVLFITRLLAEAAISKGLPVFTSETHGMAQRGGTVISHLKVGDFTSPLIMPGEADGLIALKAESVAQHGDYLKPGAWAAVNNPVAMGAQDRLRLHCWDADQSARDIDNPRAVNLIMLGFALAGATGIAPGDHWLHCSLDDVMQALKDRLKGRQDMLQASIRALQAGAGGRSLL